MSRIHLSIPYERPTPEQREQVWISIFSKLERDQESKRAAAQQSPIKPQSKDEDTQEASEVSSPPIKVDERAKALAYRDFKGVDLNGRDIRNRKWEDPFTLKV
jgi:hypothetical protein